MSKNQNYRNPDTLFTTRAGNTPQVFWGMSADFITQHAEIGDAPLNLHPQTTSEALELLAHVRAAEVAPEPFFDLVRDAAGLSMETEPALYLLLRGELPMTLAFMYPENENTLEFQNLAKNTLGETLDSYLDGAGTPQAGLLPEFRLLAAAWVRMRLMDEALVAEGAESLFDEDSRSNFEWMVRMLLYTTRPDGTLRFSRQASDASRVLEPVSEWCPELFIAALKYDSDAVDKKLGVSILPGLVSKNANQWRDELPDPSNDSPWGQSAILSQGWTSGASAMVTWGSTVPQLEILNRGTVLFSGPWTFGIQWNGEDICPAENRPWTQLCWNCSKEADYLELERKLTQNFTLQRHILLAKEAGFLLLGDVVITTGRTGFGRRNAGQLAYSSSLELGENATLAFQEQSFEGTVLRNGSHFGGTLLPLALPEWRSQVASPESDGFSQVENRLEYRVSSEYNRLYAPMFIDLSPDRAGSALTWRHLTVAEKLEPVPPHIAAGFRVMISDAQWVIYRTLTPAANRSLLGYNLNSETAVGTLLESGVVEPILSIGEPE